MRIDCVLMVNTDCTNVMWCNTVYLTDTTEFRAFY